MQESNNLNPGFITVEDAVRLIREDKADDARVDLQFLTNNIPYLKVKQTFNIRLMKTLPDGRAVRAGSRYVTVGTGYDKEVLKKTILDAFAARTGVALNPDTYGINRITTSIDQESQNMAGMPRVNTESTTKFNEDISKSYEQVLQGV